MKKLILLAIFVLSASAFAVELGVERFDYSAGSIVGRNGGSGWSAGWTLEYTQGTQEVVTPGLSFSDYPTVGGALKLTEDGVAGSFRSVGVRRLIDFDPAVGDDVWVSFLAKSDGALSALTSRQAEIRHGPSAGATEFRMRPKGGGSQGVFIAYDGSSSNSAAKSTQDGNTYLYVCRFGDVGTDTGKYAVMWVFDEAGYNASLSDGLLTEDDLNNNYYLLAQDTHANKMLNSSDGILINVGDSSSDDQFSYFFDEIRYGTSLQDVVPNPLLASSPNPSWGQQNVAPNVTLNWTAGSGVVANGHQLYFGTDKAAVESATTADTTGIYRGPVDPGTGGSENLELASRYFWRVDQVSATGTSTGYVWDFWVLANVAIDNFESYSDQAALRNSWEDYIVNGTGATIDVSTTISNGGSNSMEYLYESAYGDSLATYVMDKDLSMNNVMLVMDVAFRGTAGNSTAETLFVRLKDSAGLTSIVQYADSSALASEQWTNWHIDLTEFTNVNLSAIVELAIGFIDGGSGAGVVYFDDIAVHPCRPGGLSADVNGDCTVGLADFAIMAGQWLETKLY